MKIPKYLYGNPIEEWGSQWKDRLLPSSRSKVLQKWNASRKKPKPESSSEYTKRRIKEETKRTWRSDAADIAHEIREGVLALHPYTAIPYYGAKVGQDVLNGNVNWKTALNASIPLFHLSPQAVGLREATNVALEDAANAGSKTARNWRLAREIKLAIKNKPNIEVPKPIIRTKVGDVEIDNPNLLYHLDRGDGAGAFSNQGAYVENGFLFPGTPKDSSATPYSWWNKGKPYATNVDGQPMTRLMTATENTPGMLHVRSQNYPIGQWNGRRGFVLNSEYVNSEGVNVSGSLYNWKPGYGYKKIVSEPSTAYFGNSTLNFLKFVGNPKLGKETAANSTFYGAEKNLVEELKNSGVNLSKIPKESITLALNKRRKLINLTAPSSYTLVEGNPMLHFNYLLYDYRNGKPVGWMNVDRNKKDLNTYVQAVENTNPSYKGTYEKLLNSSIITSQSLGGLGNVSGLLLISAPKQYHVLQKFRNRKLTPYKGTHTNAKMVYDKLGIETKDVPANSMLDLSKAGDKLTKTLFNAPVWLLKSPTSLVPTKSTVFNPYIIDSNGKMHINWDDILIQHKYGGKIK